MDNKLYVAYSDRLQKMFFVCEQMGDVMEKLRNQMTFEDFVYFTEDPSFKVMQVDSLDDFLNFCPPDFVLNRICP